MANSINSFLSSVFPEELKSVKIVSVHKKAINQIIIVSSLSHWLLKHPKVFDRIFKNQIIVNYFERKNLLSECQLGVCQKKVPNFIFLEVTGSGCLAWDI